MPAESSPMYLNTATGSCSGFCNSLAEISHLQECYIRDLLLRQTESVNLLYAAIHDLNETDTYAHETLSTSKSHPFRKLSAILFNQFIE